MPLEPRFFSTARGFRSWLEKHHRKADELLVGFHKRGGDAASLSWREAVDEALCFGWIDGVRKRLDKERYTIRFAPRRAESTWSAVNIRRVAALESLGKMRAPGRKAFEQRTEKKSRTYSYEQPVQASLDASLLRQFRSNPKAWEFFQAQAPSYRRKAIHWVVGAKKQEVRSSRLDRLIQSCAKGRRL